MDYVISDLHGNYEKYMKMLDLIQFADEDHLHVLGDCIDWGQDGIRIYQDIMKRDNVSSFIGDHEMLLLRVYDNRQQESLRKNLTNWINNGGLPTLNAFWRLGLAQKKELLTYLECGSCYGPWRIIVNGNKYLLSHTAPEPRMAEDWEDWNKEEYTCGNIDYNTQYFNDMTLITGHCITGLIDPAYLGKIYRNKNHIAIDCGAAFREGRLGCLRLDDQKEFYI